MSRTRKDRPHWVRANDPKERKMRRHNHIAIRSKKIGERKFVYRPAEVVRDEYGIVIYRTDEMSWLVNVYDRWVEYIGCNIDEPMTKTSNWAREGCWTYALDLGYGWSRHSAKTAVSQARRHHVKQQLHVAITNSDWDVDIQENPLYAKNCWWD